MCVCVCVCVCVCTGVCILVFCLVLQNGDRYLYIVAQDKRHCHRIHISRKRCDCCCGAAGEQFSAKKDPLRKEFQKFWGFSLIEGKEGKRQTRETTRLISPVCALYHHLVGTPNEYPAGGETVPVTRATAVASGGKVLGAGSAELSISMSTF